MWHLIAGRNMYIYQIGNPKKFTLYFFDWILGQEFTIADRAPDFGEV
jgi:hypothetical protein